MIKLIFLLVCASAVSVLLGNLCKSFVLPFTVCVGCVVFLMCAVFLEDTVNHLRSMVSAVGIRFEYIAILLKVCGIAYLCEFASNVCRDSGQATFAMKIETVGKFLILGQTLPLFSELLNIIRMVFPA